MRKHIGLALGGERGLSGRDNLRYFGALQHLARRDAGRRVDEVLDLVGLAEAGGTLVERYSRGTRQRLPIGRALLAEPEVIFLDEPTIGLDPQGAQEFRTLVPSSPPLARPCCSPRTTYSRSISSATRFA